MRALSPTERETQCQFFEWCALMTGHREDLALFYAIPNAGSGPLTGMRGRMAGEGMKRGVPDTHLPVARDQFTGLWIEFKRPGGKPTIDQLWWLHELAARNACTAIAWGFRDAVAITESYLDGFIALAGGHCPIGLTEDDAFCHRHMRPTNCAVGAN